MLNAIWNRVDHRTAHLTGWISLPMAISLLLVVEPTRSTALGVLMTGAVAWGLVGFFEWRRSVRQWVWSERQEIDVAPELLRAEQRTTWTRRALKHFWTWVQAAAIGQLFAVAIILVGTAVALPVRGIIELLSWIAATLR